MSIIESYVIYEFSFILSAIFIQISSKINGINKYLFISFACLPLAITASIRDTGVGTDYYAYLRYFEDAIRFDFMDLESYESNFEFGFALLINFLSIFNIDAFTISFCIYYLNGVMIVAGLRLLVGEKYLALAFLFYLNAYWLLSLNILRQSLALALHLNFIGLYLLNRKKCAILAIFSAISFHKSSLLGLICLLFLRPDHKNYKLNAIYSYLFTMLLFPLVYIFSKYIGTFDDIYYYSAVIFISVINMENALRSLIQLIIYLPFLYCILKTEKNGPYKNYYIIILLMSLAPFLGEHGTRAVYFFEVLLVPISIRYLEKNNMKSIADIFILIYLLFYYIGYRFVYIYFSSGEVIPYKIINF